MGGAEPRIWLVTGASSGFGCEIAERFGRLDVLVNNAGAHAGRSGRGDERCRAPRALRAASLRSGGAHPMPEYSDTVGKTRAFVESGNGAQPSDPAKAARAILAAMASPKPPFRLALGADTVDAFRAHHAALAAELDAWEATSRATAFD